jgi:anion-transporting  ArsA/GET3 family ATPase
MPPKSVDPLHCLSSTRVAVVIGKGGVGKTTVTAVLARSAALRGLRVAVVELDGKPVLDDLLAGTGIEVLHLTASAALAEYLDSHGLGRVSKRLATSGVIDVVATAAPGIDDIVVLGKIKQLERDGAVDLVIVDGPAAGHAVTFLQSATSLQTTVRGGPVRTQANEVAAMLTDPGRCQVVLVTLAETTPVNEAIETAFTLEDRVGVTLGAIVVNGVDDGESLALDAADPDSALHAAGRFRNARRALHRRERARLADLLAFAQLTLPQLPTSQLTADDVAMLAAAAAGATT